MKAKWLWASWANLAVATVVALELAWLVFAGMMLVPRFQWWQDRWLDPAVLSEQQVAWMPRFLEGVVASGGYAMWLILGVGVAWGLFEWRVRGDNKSLMRVSALGTAAVGLLVVSVLTAASLVIPLMLALPQIAILSRPWALEKMATVETSVGALEQAQAKQDWEGMQEQVDRASLAMDTLAGLRGAADILKRENDRKSVHELRTHLESARDDLRDARQAVREKDTARLDAALKKFHENYGALKAGAK